jgi:hypothetical protein
MASLLIRERDEVAYWSPREKAYVSNVLACSFVGSPETHSYHLEPIRIACRGLSAEADRGMRALSFLS